MRRVVAFALFGALVAVESTSKAQGAAAAPKAAPGAGPASAAATTTTSTFTSTAAAGPGRAVDLGREIETAKQFAADHDYGSAFLRFSHAYEQSHEPRLLVQMAACEKSMQQYAQAARYVEQALASPPPGLTGSEASEAHELYNSLLPSLGHVRVSVDQPGATVTVDDVAVGETPLAADVLVDQGERTFGVTKPGFHESSSVVTVGGTSQKLLDVKLSRQVEEGRVRIHTSQRNTVVLDGVLGYGNWDGRVAPGPHTLNISAPGMHPFAPDLNVVANKTHTFDVTLQPDTAGPVWLWVTGGAVVVATVVIAVVSVFHSEPGPSSGATAMGAGSLTLKWH